MSSTLVADRVEVSSPFSGAFLIEDGQSLVHAVQSGDWLEGGVAAFSSLVDAAAAVIDPIGTLIANGLGWVLDHIEPLKGWLNDFTGDAGEVEGFAQTWDNVAARMRESGQALLRRTDDVADLAGAAIDAYLAYATDASRHLAAVGDWAAAIGTGMRVASQLVRVVHDLVRDAVSQVVGTAISVAAEATLTLGIALPFAIGQISARVASLAARVGRAIVRLQRGFQELIRLVRGLQDLFARGGAMVGRMLRGDARAAAVGSTSGRSLRGLAFDTDGRIDPRSVRFSQKSVSYRKVRDGIVYTYDDILKSMKARGWDGDPIDVVRMQDGGLTSVDNTRLRVAVETETAIEARVHDPDDLLTSLESRRFRKGKHGAATTWEEAVLVRVSKQGTSWARDFPHGSLELPRVTGRPQ